MTKTQITPNFAKMSQHPTEGVIVSTTKEFVDMHPRSATTSVNPRLRPKPQSISTKQQHTDTEVNICCNSTEANKPQLYEDEADLSTSKVYIHHQFYSLFFALTEIESFRGS
jgi:hypothetical protein